MAKGLSIWIYRPDLEAAEMRESYLINKNFVYNCYGTRFYEVVERKKALQKELGELKERRKRRVFRTKVEVPHG